MPVEVAEGMIPGAVHCSRSFLEFQLCPESPMYNPIFSEDARFIFICGTGMRALLAASTAKDFGLEVAAMTGGIGVWLEEKGPIALVE